KVPEVRLVTFQDYHPPTSTQKIEFEDPLFKAYFTEQYSVHMLSMEISGTDVSELKSKNVVKIKDYPKFKKMVVSTAKELGYSEEQLRTMSIHDALMLGGKITAHRLEYDEEMISEEEKRILKSKGADGFMLYVLDVAFNKISHRNERAKQVDSSPADVIFENGSGICRNYAKVNAAVFTVLKDISPGLKNTYMRYYTPDALEHLLSLPHGWNMVATVTPTNIQVTYVDSTWLDTRSRSELNESEKISKGVSDEQIYNALDGSHFGVGNLLAEDYMASLYKYAGRGMRLLERSPYHANETIIELYRKKIFEMRVELCEKVLNLIAAKGRKSDKKNCFYKRLAQSFAKAVEGFCQGTISYFLEDGTYGCPFDDREGVKKLYHIYQRAEKEAPRALELEVRIGYTKSKIPVTMKNIMNRLRESVDKAR
ncbi:hypothetical protein KAR91_68145, partial [Candidatus Pacearchaeota archaeon]|nr:hypothetical protein [Candidatus Pacearchaeota archaeon]